MPHVDFDGSGRLGDGRGQLGITTAASVYSTGARPSARRDAVIDDPGRLREAGVESGPGAGAATLTQPRDDEGKQAGAMSRNHPPQPRRVTPLPLVVWHDLDRRVLNQSGERAVAMTDGDRVAPWTEGARSLPIAGHGEGRLQTAGRADEIRIGQMYGSLR